MQVVLNVKIDEQLGVVARSSGSVEASCNGDRNALFDQVFIGQLGDIHERRADLDTYRKIGKVLFEQILAGEVLTLLRTLEESVRATSATLFITLEMTRHWQQFPGS